MQQTSEVRGSLGHVGSSREKGLMGETEKYSESLSSPRRCAQTARIFRFGCGHLKFQERASSRRRELERMRRLLLSVVVFAGLFYVGRQYSGELGRLVGASTRAVSRVERPSTSAVPGRNLEIFNGCGMEGDARSLGVRALDRLENRYRQPSPEQIDSRITLAAILARGNDISCWKVKDGADIVGYVSDVKRGGIESTNCRARDDADRDTHIELVLDPMNEIRSRRVIIEVTPRWRYIMRERGADWSTRALRDQLLGRWVKVDGWMLFEAEHQRESENTAPRRPENWRATAWEIHPVTSIQVVARPRREGSADVAGLSGGDQMIRPCQ